MSKDIGDVAGQIYILSNLGLTLRDQGELVTAQALLTEGLQLAQSQDDTYQISFFLTYLSTVSLQVHMYDQAIEQASAALKMRQDDVALATGVGHRFIVELEAGKPSCQLGRALVVAAAVGLRVFDLMAANNDTDNALLPDLIDDLPEDDERG